MSCSLLGSVHRCLLAFVFCSVAHAAPPVKDAWQDYVSAQGFSVDLSSRPKTDIRPIPSGDEMFILEALEPIDGQSKFQVFRSIPAAHGLVSPASVDVFLRQYVTSLVSAVDSGQLEMSKRSTFLGRPANLFTFHHQVNETPYIGRGVVFVVDGGHIRLSMWHPADDKRADERFLHFVNSFKLVPVAYEASKSDYRSKLGMRFTPPRGWVEDANMASPVIARFRSNTRSINLLAAGDSTYKCTDFVKQIQRTGRLKSNGPVVLGGRSFLKLTTFEDVPKFDVRLTTAQYCLDSSRFGASSSAEAKKKRASVGGRPFLKAQHQRFELSSF